MLRQLVVNYHIQQNELKLCHTSIEIPVNLFNGCGGSEIIRENNTIAYTSAFWPACKNLWNWTDFHKNNNFVNEKRECTVASNAKFNKKEKKNHLRKVKAKDISDYNFYF